MDTVLFRSSPTGRLVKTDDGLWAFVPNPLPPVLNWDASLSALLADSAQALGVLVGLGETLPNPHLLIYPFIRREAVLSSRIEGTQSTLSDLFLAEAENGEKKQDVQEVQNYVIALEYGLAHLGERKINLEFLKELHKILMKDVRGAEKRPGEFRNEQNWIGPPGCNKFDATYVPPPVSEMHKLLHHFEEFIKLNNTMHSLIKAALLHAQFEAIHPFHDGNGRIGRLLIILYLHKKNLLLKPLLYISAFFEKYRSDYYDALLKIWQQGAWRSWIDFFLRGIITQSHDAITRARQLVNLQQEYNAKVLENRLSPTAGKLLNLIFMRPVINIRSASNVLKLTFPAVSKAMKQLEQIDILREITGGKRDRIYKATRILEVLEK